MQILVHLWPQFATLLFAERVLNLNEFKNHTLSIFKSFDIAVCLIEHIFQSL